MTPYDFVANNPAVIAEANKKGITPLVQETDYTLISTRKELKQTTTLLAITTTNNRELLEAPIDAATNLGASNKQDFLHHRRSDLDQVAAKLLKQKNAALILNLQQLKQTKNPGRVLGRIQQNARIAKKLGVNVILASFAQTPEELHTIHDQEAKWKALDISEELVTQNQETIQELLKQAKHRRSDAYIAEGITKKE